MQPIKPYNQIVSRIRVKFCGITQLKDAEYAEKLGIDALGFNFKRESLRYINFADAKIIIDKLSPFIVSVGLFVNEDRNIVNETAEYLNLSCLQFHGDESVQYCNSFSRPYIKAIRVQTQQDIINASKKYLNARALLLDSYSIKAYGGTGTKFDWDIIPKNLTKPIILAGGLNETNVKEAIAKVNPYAVDVSSGIESSDGVKSHEKMQKFMNEVYYAQKN